MRLVTNLIEAHIFRKINNGIEFLLLKRADSEIYPGIWQMVSGKIKNGEKAYETALREIFEETALKPKMFWAAPNVNSFYDHNSDSISFLPVFAALAADDAAVKISEEHTEYIWTAPEDAKKLLAWPGQRTSVDIICRYFTEEIDFLNFVEIKI